MTIIEFERFYRIGSDVMTLPETKHSVVLQRFSKRHKEPQVVIFLCLRYCYQKLYSLEKRKLSSCVNDYLLDFETLTSECTLDKVIVVYGKQDEKYCFSIKEILQIFQSDLCRSVLIYDEHLRVYTVVKNFRLPYNPYMNERFTLKDLDAIVSQMAVNVSTLPKEFQEVYIFLKYRHMLLGRCAGQDPYSVTTILNQFFEKQGFRFQEKYKKSVKENQSYWKILSSFVMNGKDLYFWFILHVFINHE